MQKNQGNPKKNADQGQKPSELWQNKPCPRLFVIKQTISRLLTRSIYTFLLAMMGLCCQNALAQFNDTTFYHTGYTSSGSINKTKDGTAYLLNNGLRFNVKRKDISLNFNNSWVYGRQQGDLTNNDFSTTLDFNLYVIAVRV
jgi:hypothetical protein